MGLHSHALFEVEYTAQAFTYALSGSEPLPITSTPSIRGSTWSQGRWFGGDLTHPGEFSVCICDDLTRLRPPRDRIYAGLKRVGAAIEELGGDRMFFVYRKFIGARLGLMGTWNWPELAVSLIRPPSKF